MSRTVSRIPPLLLPSATFRWCCFALIWELLAPCAYADDSNLTARRDLLDRQYTTELAQLADWCDREKLPTQAEIARGWLPVRRPDEIVLFVLSDEHAAQSQPAETPNGGADLAEWNRRFMALRKARGEALYDLALAASEAGQLSLVPPLLFETLREVPNHARARRALGYEQFRDGWHTAFAREMLAAGKVWSDQFGWIAAADRERYERGERPWAKQWISEDEDTRRRKVIANGWRIQTEHFVVTTNHSQQDGVKLAQQLERLHQVWRQLFVEYYATPAEVRAALEGRVPLRTGAKPHQVVYYNTRDEFNAALVAAQPNIAMTLGIYFDNRRKAYFFAGQEQHAGTLFHEATHQLFQETRTVQKNVGKLANFWIIEGIAAYMESIVEHDGYVTVGGHDEGRVPAARQRLLIDNYYVPLATLTGMGIQEIQHDPAIARLYSQSAGLATFFMHYQQGRYRDALVRYLVAIYTAKDKADSLATLTGVSFDALDRQYREFLQPE